MTHFSTEGVHVETLADPELTSPVMIEGLPGVGHVGKLAADHLIEERENTVVRRLLSEHFPPQVSVDDDGVASLPTVEIHHVPTNAGDLLVLRGDHQAATAIGHYRVTAAVLDIANSFGTANVFALGGIPTGELQEEPRVLGAVSRDDLRAPLIDHGVEFSEQEPAGGVVGLSGLLLGMGAERDLDVACLMGETSGYLVDPKSAQAVLEVLEGAIGFTVSYEELEARAAEMERVVRRLQEMQDTPQSPDDDLRYIG